MNPAPSKQLTYAVWTTAWGPMGAVCGPEGVGRIVLPHYEFDQLEKLLRWEHPGARRDEAPLVALIDRTRRYFNAEVVDFDDIPCRMPGATTFAGRVHRAARTIAYGRTRSYSALADQIGRPEAARAVAAAMGRNPLPLIVPCHRVTYADGRAGGFSAPGGVEQKRRLLELERRAIGDS